MSYSWVERAGRSYLSRLLGDDAAQKLQAQGEDGAEDYPTVDELQRAYANLMTGRVTFSQRLDASTLPELPISGFITDKNELVAELARRIRATGLPLQTLYTRYGLVEPLVRKILAGGVIEDDFTASVEDLCRFLNVRYPFLPFEGMPHLEGVALWHEVEERAATYGIAREEFTACFGLSYDEMRAAILSGKSLWPREFCEMLSRKLHIRIWPEPTGIVAQGIEDVAAETKYLRTLWRMNRDDFASALGQPDLTAHTVASVENAKVQLYGWRSEHLQRYAQSVGLTVKGPATLPVLTEKFYVSDPDVFSHINERIRGVGLPLTVIAELTDIDIVSLRKLLDGFRSSHRNQFREMMTKICDYLRIPLHTPADHPPVYLSPSVAATPAERRQQNLTAIREAARDLQKNLSLTDVEMGKLTGLNPKSLARFLGGSDTVLEAEAISSLMRVMGIYFDISLVAGNLDGMIELEYLPARLPQPLLLNGPSATGKWRFIAHALKMGISKDEFKQQYGLTDYEFWQFTKNELPLMHPGNLRIAEDIGLYTPEILQALLERDRPGDVVAYLAAKGLKLPEARKNLFFSLYPQTPGELRAIIELRMQLLKKFHEGKSSPAAEEVAQARFWLGCGAEGGTDDEIITNFLNRTGGDLQAVQSSDVEHLNYLMSLGDSYSAVNRVLVGILRRGGIITGSRRQIELLGPIVTDYNNWRGRMFGHAGKIPDMTSSSRQSRELPGKFAPVVFDRMDLEKSYAEVDRVHSIEREKKIRDEMAALAAKTAAQKKKSGGSGGTPRGGMKLSGLNDGPLSIVNYGDAGDDLKSSTGGDERELSWHPGLGASVQPEATEPAPVFSEDDTAGLPQWDVASDMLTASALGISGMMLMPPVRGVM